jgi:protein TonB
MKFSTWNFSVLIIMVIGLFGFKSVAFANQAALGFNLTNLNVTLESSNGNAVNDQQVIVEVMPKYPRQAGRDGKGGVITLGFTVTEAGEVEDIKVIHAEPTRIFNKVAKRALKKWKFKPKVVDGKSIKQTNLIQTFKFSIGPISINHSPNKD